MASSVCNSRLDSVAGKLLPLACLAFVSALLALPTQLSAQAGSDFNSRQKGLYTSIQRHIADEELEQAEAGFSELMASTQGQKLDPALLLKVHDQQYRLRVLQTLSCIKEGEFTGSDDQVQQLVAAVESLSVLYDSQISQLREAGRNSALAVQVARLQQLYVETARIHSSIARYESGLSWLNRADALFEQHRDLMETVVSMDREWHHSVTPSKQPRWQATGTYDSQKLLSEKIALLALWNQSDPAAASALYDQSLRMYASGFPGDLTSYQYLRTAFALDGQVDIAELQALLQKCENRDDPVYSSNLVSLGNLLHQKGRTEEALANFLLAISLNCPPQRLAEAHAQAGVCYSLLDNRTEALRHFELSKAFGGGPRFSLDEQIAGLTGATLVKAPPVKTSPNFPVALIGVIVATALALVGMTALRR